MPILAPGSVSYINNTSGAKLIKRALRLIGAIDPGEELPATELNDGMESLNAMLDAWNTEKLTVFCVEEIPFVLTAGTDAYTIGEGGDINCQRPPKIESAKLRDSALAEYPLDVYTSQQWRGLDRTNAGNGIPEGVYYDAAFPLGNLTFFRPPDANYTLLLYVWRLLNQIKESTTVVSFPPGYADAIAYNLAIRLAPEYGKATSQEVIGTANTTKANLKRVNIQPIYMACDSALTAPHTFDITRGY